MRAGRGGGGGGGGGQDRFCKHVKLVTSESIWRGLKRTNHIAAKQSVYLREGRSYLQFRLGKFLHLSYKR